MLKPKKTHSHLLDQIGTAEQTSVFLYMLTPVSVAKKSWKSVTVQEMKVVNHR